MTHAIRVHKVGGPDVLSYEPVEIGEPGPGEAKIRQEAIGLNFIDVYYRTGLYKAPSLPFIPGNEGAGIVISVGPGVSNIKPGDRVAYVALGAYAEERIVPADRLVIVPDGIDLKTAAAVMLKGMTAQYLLRRTFHVKKGDTILIHAAAGGVGLIAGQWAKHLGATVIGTASSPEKIELAKANGYDHVINYRTENFVERVKELTGGQGVDVVYDSVGKDTFPASLDVLKPFGMFVSFGQSSGSIPPFDIAILQQKGSLFATRPSLNQYTAKRHDLEAIAKDLFSVIESGVVSVHINQTYALKDAAKAHADLESRKTTGVSVLIP
ncbi:quinone oxidoreductase family protein [Phyllobacterium leguminum]|uniref:NADPH:quinone reductase-like Zn-dependent oxidoreductase n=1 Tax=Phyllobacterium leguminum TaxID=314237 RepID=A0A318T5V9_9HYPH|nr:quinone oxidoreductase [Phyllobacterium leguminum]PYE88245.1 NADPH:quinone reductase-like Zn-dependent oxidoreductase [Phyllobacterium leguminum]